MNKKITDEYIAKAIRSEVDKANSWQDGELADQQADALRLYFGEPFGNEKPGFSQIVTRDVLEAVEGIMPELMKIFTSGDNFVEFEPQGQEDVELSEQETDYINYLFSRRVDGFSILYNWMKDALLMKNGIVQVGWCEEERIQFHRFTDLDEDEVELLEDEDGLEIISKEEDEETGLWEVKVSKVETIGKPFVELVPSEEFRIKERSANIKTAGFTARVRDRTVGEMIEDGFDEEDLQAATVSDRTDDSAVSDARFSTPSEESGTSNAAVTDYDKEIEVIEAYIDIFDPKESRTKIYHVIQVGNKVLSKEEVKTVGFINLSPIMVPHKFTGVSIADLIKDIQLIRSELYRNTLDNLALTNAGRYSVIEGQVNLQDLMDNKIGGIVRQKMQGAVQQLPTPQIGQATFPFLQELEQEKEDRVGVSKMTQGLDPNALTSNTAATAVNQVMSAAQQKILLIARVFAETGIKELFLQLHSLAKAHQDKSDVVRLRGKFVEVNPFDWSDRYDMTVTVGIGNGNKDQQLYHLNNITQMLQQIGNTKFGYLINANHVHSLAREHIKNSGYKNPDQFIGDPSVIQEPEQQPTPEMVAAQADKVKADSDAQSKQARLGMDAQELELKKGQQQLDTQEYLLEMAKFEWKKKVEAAELGLEAQQGRPVGIGK
ncbi:hypothetical protein N8314_00655 [Akkermansiaceae bacterium]|nr:hypothetical protein [Akkermansiaceae bacterium]